MAHTFVDPTLQSGALGYELPDELIARYPATERDGSRLLVVDRKDGTWSHAHFHELPHWLMAGDAVVLNRTRVRSARTWGHRTTGGRVELLWLHQNGSTWKTLARPATKLRSGEILNLASGLEATVVSKEPDGMVQMSVPTDVDMEAWLERHGQVPLPPYLGRDAEPADRERYQTVFAREAGAVAAPTAGLHFTPRTFEALRLRGVTIAELVLHVGPGTFRPIKTHLVHEHRLDPEHYFIPEETWSLVDPNRNSRGRTLAVGTTVVRALESAAMGPASGNALTGWSDLLIAPPFDFRVVDALLTNFHLPSSSLLALVAAFAGLELTLACYRAAVEARYRFYSYGDAMLIL